MELWIRSQDKENTVKIINQYGLKYNDKKTIIANYQPDFMDKYDGYYETLGTYNSKERALEVLDEIETAIVNNYAYELATSSGIRPDNIQGGKFTGVYEMPKE